MIFLSYFDGYTKSFKILHLVFDNAGWSILGYRKYIKKCNYATDYDFTSRLKFPSRSALRVMVRIYFL